MESCPHPGKPLEKSSWLPLCKEIRAHCYNKWLWTSVFRSVMATAWGISGPWGVLKPLPEECGWQNGFIPVLTRNGDAVRKETAVPATAGAKQWEGAQPSKRGAFWHSCWGTQCNPSSPIQCLWSALWKCSSQEMITFTVLAGALKERQEEECRACFGKSNQGEDALLILQSIALPHFPIE